MSRLDWPAGFERTPESEREPNRSFEATLGSIDEFQEVVEAEEVMLDE